MTIARKLRTTTIATVALAAASATCFALVDSRTHAFFVALSKAPWVLITREFVTPFGKVDRLAGLLIVLWLIGLLRQNTRFRQAAVSGIISLVWGGALAVALKFATHRARPYIPPEQMNKSFSAYYQSFPSADTACVVAVAIAVGACLPRWRLPLFAIAITVASMRVLRLAHWPSDVLMGGAIGCAGYLISEMLRDRRTKQ